MREIRQSGSEGGAVMSRPYPYRSGPRSDNEKYTRLVNPRRLRILKLKPMGINPAPTAGKELRIDSMYGSINSIVLPTHVVDEINSVLLS
jgi:hypothetical protein